MRISITTKIILTIFVLIVAPLTAGGTWLFSDLQNSLAQVEAERGTSDMEAAQQMIDYMGENWASFVKTNAYWSDHHEAIANDDRDFINDSVLANMDVNGDLAAAYVTDVQGKLIAKREKEPQNLEAQFGALVNKLGQEMSMTGLVRTDKGLQLLAMSKVTNEEGTAVPNGILYFLQPVDPQFLQKIQNVNNTKIVLYDGQALTGAIHSFDSASAAAMLERLKGEQAPVSESSQASGVQTTQTFDLMPDIFGQPVAVLGTETQSATGATIRADLLKKAGIGAVLLVMIFALISLVFYTQFSQPLVRLRKRISHVASGDLSDSEEMTRLVQVKRRDEIGDIIQAFVQMTDGLKSLVAKVHDGSNTLTDRSHEFAASTEEARGTLDQIAASSSDINGLVERTFDAVEDTVGKLLVLEEQSRNITSASQTAVGAAESMKRAAGEGQQQVERSIETMLNVTRSSEESESRVIALQQVAEEIHAIVDRIKSIAKQTGMLALNASIEAVRAGEHGRGFSIVAQEVGKLSDQASEATDEIEGQIERIKHSVVDVCETSDDLRGKLAGGVVAVESTRHLFADILLHVNDVEEQIRQIRSEAHKQEGITQQGVQAVQEVSAMAAEMVSSVSEASQAAEEALSTM
ncbi:MAG: methyl-accepting chemotaxis protein, partial [Tumebacillaceae bacterium]